MSTAVVDISSTPLAVINGALAGHDIDIKTNLDRFRDLNIGQRQEVYMIDPHKIVVEPGFNPRDFSLAINRQKLDTLKLEIIAMKGVQQPVWIRWDNKNKIPYLIDGERRLRATLELIAEGHEIVSIPATQKTKSVDSVADRLYLALTANEGVELSQIELGATYLRLNGYGHTVDKIAIRTGKSERFVRDAIALADAPEAVQALVASGDVSADLAIKTTKKHGDGAVDALQAAVKDAKANGKKQAKSIKTDKKLSKLNNIAIIIAQYDDALEAAEDAGTQVSKSELSEFLGQISDVLNGEADTVKV